MQLLAGKKALVCGVANKTSIGWGIAQALRAHGAEIALTCLDGNVRRVKKLARQVDSDLVMPLDVRSDDEIPRAFEAVAAGFAGRLDILVHSLAYANFEDLEGEFIKVSRSDWNEALEVSVYSLVALARQARPLLQAAGGGSVMTLTYVGGETVVPGYNVMGVAKAALVMAVRYLAHDLGPENIRVNAISAGPVATLSSLMVESFDASLRFQDEVAPLRRNITLEELGGTAVFLASELAASITGSIITVDSGTSCLSPAAGYISRLKAETGMA